MIPILYLLRMLYSHKCLCDLGVSGLLDQSLPSLQFSESSLEGGAAALEQVLQLVDKTMGGELSSDERGARHSTPQHHDKYLPLELVGKEMKTHVRQLGQGRLHAGQRSNPSQSAGDVGVKSLQRTRSGQTASQVKPVHSKSAASKNTRKPRNYNIKD